MSGILGGKNRLICRNLPIDPDLRVIPCYCSLILRRIQIVALILENSLLGKDAESMCKPARHKKLTKISNLYVYDLSANCQNLSFKK